MADDNSRPPRQLGGELVIPILGIGFTLYFFSTIWNSPWTAQVSAFLLGGLLIFFCLLFMLRCVLWMRAGEGTLGVGNLFTYEDLRSGRIGLLIVTVLFCVLVDWLGFTLTTFLFMVSSMAILSRFRNLGFITGLSAVIALTGWALFIWAFDTRFPRGWFETTMKAVLANG